MKRATGKSTLSWLLFLVMILAGSLVPGTAVAKNADVALPGQGIHKAEFELADGQTLRYSLAVPDLPEGETAPLVLALHYGGEVTPYFSLAFLRQFAAPGFAALSPVIIAPDCPGRGWTDPLSERAVLALLDHALENWPVDPDRVVITGFSLGGGGTWHMIGRHPDRFSVAVPVAGWPSVEPDGSVPVYAIHGELDDRIDVEPTRQAIAALQKEGAIATLVMAKGLSHYQTSSYVTPLIQAASWIEDLWSIRE